jgi:hypothetical protein
MAELRRIGRVSDVPGGADNVEITDIVEEVAAPRTEEDRLAALSAADAAKLRTNRAAYTAFQMVGGGAEEEGCKGLYALPRGEGQAAPRRPSGAQSSRQTAAPLNRDTPQIRTHSRTAATCWWRRPRAACLTWRTASPLTSRWGRTGGGAAGLDLR